MGKSENSEFLETIATSDLTVSRSSHLIEYRVFRKFEDIIQKYPEYLKRQCFSRNSVIVK